MRPLYADTFFNRMLDIENFNAGRYQSGQMGWTVNPLAQPSEVRIFPGPQYVFFYNILLSEKKFLNQGGITSHTYVSGVQGIF